MWPNHMPNEQHGHIWTPEGGQNPHLGKTQIHKPLIAGGSLDVVATNQTGRISSTAPATVCTDNPALVTFLDSAGNETWALARLARPITEFYAVVHRINGLDLIVASSGYETYLALDWILTDSVDLSAITWNNRNTLSYGGNSRAFYGMSSFSFLGGSQATVTHGSDLINLMAGDLFGGISGTVPTAIGATAYGVRMRWITTVPGAYQFGHSGLGSTAGERANALKVFSDIRVPSA